MTAREQLWYLVRGVVNGTYELNTFCDEFYRIYNFETDKSQLTELERELFGTLFEMQGRFSEFEEDLKIPNMYITGEELLQMAKTVARYETVCSMNNMQRKFFEHLAYIQNRSVEVCMIQHKCQDDVVRNMLYDVTYEVITDMMELIDGYSEYSADRHDIVNMVTGECLKENPFLELHDRTEEFLRYAYPPGYTK